jgi:general secretion pathway protein G
MNILNYLTAPRSQVALGNGTVPAKRSFAFKRVPKYNLGTRSKGKRGFTLMEMIIVLSIIALLMGMVIYKFGNFADFAKIKRVQTDMLGFREALSTYEMQTGTLPTTDQGLKALWQKPTTEPIPDQWRKVMDEEELDPWNHSYHYENPGKHNTDGYDIWSDGSGDGKVYGNWKDTGSDSTSSQ